MDSIPFSLGNNVACHVQRAHFGTRAKCLRNVVEVQSVFSLRITTNVAVAEVNASALFHTMLVCKSLGEFDLARIFSVDWVVRPVVVEADCQVKRSEARLLANCISSLPHQFVALG